MSSSEVIQKFSDRRQLNEMDRDRRIEEVYRKVPEIGEIDRKIKKIGMESSIKIMAGDKELKSEAERLINELIKEKKKLLKDHGFPEDIMDLRYTCDKCKDQGFLEDGKRCECLNRELMQVNEERSSLKGLLKTQNFDTFDINLFSDKPYKKETKTPRENMKDILKVAKIFVNSCDEMTDNLFFYGPTGTGKTFLSSAIAKGFIDKGKSVLYQSIFGVIKICEAYQFRKEGIDLFENLFKVDLLLIDDLGSEMDNAFTVSAIFDVINTRIINDKKILISSNLNLGRELQEKYSERIYSRLMQFIKLRFYGEDLRKKL